MQGIWADNINMSKHTLCFATIAAAALISLPTTPALADEPTKESITQAILEAETAQKRNETELSKTKTDIKTAMNNVAVTQQKLSAAEKVVNQTVRKVAMTPTQPMIFVGAVSSLHDINVSEYVSRNQVSTNYDAAIATIDRSNQLYRQLAQSAQTLHDLKDKQQKTEEALKDLRQKLQEFESRLAPHPDLVVSQTQEEVAFIVTQQLRGEGFTEEAIAGILGNLQQESTLNPALHQANGGIGRGLAQWSTGGRWDTSQPNLLAYAKQQNLPPYSAEAQTGFMLLEMKNGWGGFNLEHYKNLTDVAAATIYFHDVYERSADSPEFVANVRVGYAATWYNWLKKHPPAT